MQPCSLLRRGTEGRCQSPSRPLYTRCWMIAPVVRRSHPTSERLSGPQPTIATAGAPCSGFPQVQGECRKERYRRGWLTFAGCHRHLSESAALTSLPTKTSHMRAGWLRVASARNWRSCPVRSMALISCLAQRSGHASKIRSTRHCERHWPSPYSSQLSAFPTKQTSRCRFPAPESGRTPQRKRAALASRPSLDQNRRAISRPWPSARRKCSTGRRSACAGR